jgi:hypothetical protein
MQRTHSVTGSSRYLSQFSICKLKGMAYTDSVANEGSTTFASRGELLARFGRYQTPRHSHVFVCLVLLCMCTPLPLRHTPPCAHHSFSLTLSSLFPRTGPGSQDEDKHAPSARPRRAARSIHQPLARRAPSSGTRAVPS